MPTFLRLFFFFLLLLLLFSYYTPSVSCYTVSPIHTRRTLHQPFFPMITQPPANPPSPSPLPKYPSSTTPLPFFPLFPSPPPPPSLPATTSSIPNLPANISSLTFPISSSSPARSRSKKLAPAIVLPILSLALLGLALAFFLRYRRRHPRGKPSRAESDCLFPANAAASDGGRKLSSSSAPVSSEFLYLGTVVNSRGGVGNGPAAAAPPAADPSHRRLDSPELQPLPPLSRHVRQGEVHPEQTCCSSEEEFYSPRVSSAGKENPGGAMGTASRRAFPAAVMEKCGSDSSTLSAPSYRSSDSASSPTPSPSSHSSASTPGESTDGGAMADSAFRPHAPPPPAPPMTTSSPKRKPPSPSSPSSPLQKDSNFSAVPSQPPPRPPPPPPAGGCWEAKASKVLPCEPPALVSPRTMGLESMAAVHPAESMNISNAGLKDSEEATPRPKLKPLHWDKVRPNSDREMVWDQLKWSSFQLNEQMIETLFVCNDTNATPKEVTRRAVLLLNQENRVLDPKKSQNIAILLRALNLTKEEVCEALMEGNTDSLGTELLHTLLKMAPSKEEELKLKEYRDDSPFKLDPAEIFLKAVLDIPFAFKRVDTMLYIANFGSEINYLRKSFETLLAACEELRSSRLFFKLLEAVLKTGNRMNVGTNRGDAHAFKLDTLLKLVDIKGTDGKTTLLHFVVQEIVRAEGPRLVAANQTITTSKNHTCTVGDDLECKKLGLLVVARLGGELSNVKKAADMDSEVLAGYVSKLAKGIGKVNEAARLNDSLITAHESGRRFHEAMHGFLKEAQEEIMRIQSQERFTLALVKETTEYFHGNAAEEAAHPFRIFVIMRDFLSILDQVCKEAGKINERTMVGSAQQFLVPASPMLTPLFPKFHPNVAESSDEDDSSSPS